MLNIWNFVFDTVGTAIDRRAIKNTMRHTQKFAGRGTRNRSGTFRQQRCTFANVLAKCSTKPKRLWHHWARTWRLVLRPHTPTHTSWTFQDHNYTTDTSQSKKWLMFLSWDESEYIIWNSRCYFKISKATGKPTVVHDFLDAR